MKMFAKIGLFFKTRWHDAKARRRGERRIAAPGTRGRVYERRDGAKSPAGRHEVAGKIKDISVGITVTRADGTIEEIGTVPGKLAELAK